MSIADGDTLTILDETQRQHKVRIQGIAAPEKKQPFETRSQQSLADIVFSAQVVAECPKRDRYGRLVCKVSVGELDVGLEQVRRGMAWWYKQYSREQAPMDPKLYAAAERLAEDKKAGLWHESQPIAPWHYRRNGRHKAFSALDLGAKWYETSNEKTTCSHWSILFGFSLQ